MSCSFLDSLTSEQRTELLKALTESTKFSSLEYHAEVSFWNKEKTKVKSLAEFRGNKKHGLELYWREDGRIESKAEFQYDNRIFISFY